MTQAELIQKWAKHVDDCGHPSHRQDGSPLYELRDCGEQIVCVVAGCWWSERNAQGTENT